MIQPVFIFLWIYAAMVAHSFWEAYVEGRNAWDKRKLGWKLTIGRYCLPAYHFWLFWIMYPILLSLPLVIYGWDFKLFGILISAYASGMVIQDFMWYVVNPEVKISEFWTSFSDYFPFLKIGGRKIVPWGYIAGIIVAVLSWWFLWR
jgi:hypothetical protein